MGDGGSVEVPIPSSKLLGLKALRAVIHIERNSTLADRNDVGNIAYIKGVI